MKRVLMGLSILFVLAACEKNDNSYLVKEIIRLENQVIDAEFERDMYKARLEKYEGADYLVQPDSTYELSLNSAKAFVRFYPN